jgi:cytochrome c peroxidase
MRITSLIIALLILLVAGFSSCKKEQGDLPLIQDLAKQPTLPNPDYDYEGIEFPEAWNNSALDLFESIPNDNPITNAGATLGRVLFYDTDLSRDHSISCASCHKQAHAFSDDVAFSVGINNAVTPRNSMALFNLQFSRRFFWDRRSNSLESQVLQPIQHPGEMDLSLEELISRLESSPFYPTLFSSAFGDETITEDRISKALAQFTRSIRSFKSKYDEGLVSDFSNYSAQELEGKDLFFNGITRCNQCHMTVNFYTPGALNNGLEVEYADGGVQNVSENESDNGRFKVVSLRNIEITAPYMHDGRFNTL